MTKQKNRQHDQEIPAQNHPEKSADLTKGIGAGKRVLREHEIAVYHKKKRNADTAKIINGIMNHAYTVKAHNADAGKAFDQIKIYISRVHKGSSFPLQK